MDALKQINVLVSLYKGYGLGDAVQMSAVLRHARKYRPHWIIDFQAEPGREDVGRGIAHNVFQYGQPYPSAHYDAEVQILLYDTWANWHDRPNTRVSSCLHERFGLDWDAECGRYQIQVSNLALAEVGAVINPKSVGIHYEGDSSPDRKNLTHDRVREVCHTLTRLGYFPLLLDWRDKSPLRSESWVTTIGGWPQSLEWGRSAEYNCAAISLCSAFVGIDSGPGKCAGATDTPSLIVWTGHHPACFYDPAPNVTHLVPMRYQGLEPACKDPVVIQWFEQHNKVRFYEQDPVPEIKKWLTKVLS